MAIAEVEKMVAAPKSPPSSPIGLQRIEGALRKLEHCKCQLEKSVTHYRLEMLRHNQQVRQVTSGTAKGSQMDSYTKNHIRRLLGRRKMYEQGAERLDTMISHVEREMFTLRDAVVLHRSFAALQIGALLGKEQMAMMRLGEVEHLLEGIAEQHTKIADTQNLLAASTTFMECDDVEIEAELARLEAEEQAPFDLSAMDFMAPPEFPPIPDVPLPRRRGVHQREEESGRELEAVLA